MVEQILLKLFHPLLIGSLERTARIGIEVDEVDLGFDAVQQFDQLLGRFDIVVEIFDHQILEHHPFSLVYGELLDRLDDALDIVGFVDRHQFLAQLVIYRMQADR